MYPPVFSLHWIKGIWYNLFHPSLFCWINDNWNWGETLWLKKVGGKDIWGDFLRGEETHKDTMLIKQASFYVYKKSNFTRPNKENDLDRGRYDQQSLQE